MTVYRINLGDTAHKEPYRRPDVIIEVGFYIVSPDPNIFFLKSDQTLGLLHSPFALMLRPHL